MQHRERWQELAELALAERDPVKRMELVKEINLLLEQKDPSVEIVRVPASPKAQPKIA